MHQRSISRALRSPVASTVFAVVFGLGGLAVAGVHTEQRGEAFGSAQGEIGHGGGAKAGDRTQGPDADGRTHGVVVSAFARSTGLEGWQKGAGVSALASSDRSQAGEHGPHGGEERGNHAHPEQTRPAAPNARADGPALPSGDSEGRSGTVSG